MPVATSHLWRGQLSAEETAALALHVAALARAGLPLGEGLRAAAGELPGRRLRRVLAEMAVQLDAGATLDAALAAQGRRLPDHFRGLLLAGVRSGRLADVLDEFSEFERDALELRRRVWLALAYPAILVVMLMGIGVFLQVSVIAEMRRMYSDFGIGVPPLTQLFLNTSKAGTWTLVISVSTVAGLLAVTWALPGVAWCTRLWYGIPVIGAALRSGRLAQFARLLALLLEGEVPLPDALRLAGAAVRDPDLGTACRRVALEIEAGRPLGECLADHPQFPLTIVPVVAWGQQAGQLPAAFRATAELFDGQAQGQSRLLEMALLPLLLLVISLFVGLFVLAMLMPLVSLIQKLS